jgi:hypothetical protein
MVLLNHFDFLLHLVKENVLVDEYFQHVVVIQQVLLQMQDHRMIQLKLLMLRKLLLLLL